MNQCRYSLTAFCISLATLATLFSTAAQAKVVQIIHTNDLHASLQTSGTPKENEIEYGNWARIKYVMDDLTAKAKAKGIETLRLDAGDFFEGTLNYFPDYGKTVLHAFQSLNYDAVTVGNHDWLMGARSMNQAFGLSPFPFPILSANISIKRNLSHLKTQITPFTHIVKDGIKFGILGLSTAEALYRWIPEVGSRRNDFRIRDYDDDDQDEAFGPTPGIANRLIKKLHADSDVVIALTHIGFGEDQNLAAASKNLDLIIGGHSHTVLESLNVVPDLEGREVPIVQTGVNGKYIGKILLEVNPGQRARVISYELVPVPLDGPKDPVTDALVQEAFNKVQTLYTPEKLNEPIGKSEVRLISGDTGPSAYSKFIVDAMKDATGAELAIDVDAFHGNTPQPAGVVTMKNLMEMYPRKFEVERNEGLYVYHASIPGWVLALGVRYAIKWGYYISFSGLTFDAFKMSDEEYAQMKNSMDLRDSFYISQYEARNIRINGEKICYFCGYNIAAPESLIRGAYGVSSLLKLIIRHGAPTESTIWEASKNYLAKIKVIQKVKWNDHFNVKEFSPGYQRGQALEPIHEQLSEGESLEAPWHLESRNFNSGMQHFLKDLKKGLANPGFAAELVEDEAASATTPEK